MKNRTAKGLLSLIARCSEMFLSFTSKGSFFIFLQDLFIYFCKRTEKERGGVCKHLYMNMRRGEGQREKETPH